MVEAKYWYDDVERGEMYQHAVIAAQYGVPIMLVTGDEATCREARETFGDDVPTVAVKKGISREAAVLLAPAETRALLRQGARRAMEALPRLRPFDVRFPVKVRMRRIGPNPADHQNPYFIDTDWDATSAADIISKGER
jgi:D-amino peptidase